MRCYESRVAGPHGTIAIRAEIRHFCPLYVPIPYRGRRVTGVFQSGVNSRGPCGSENH